MNFRDSSAIGVHPEAEIRVCMALVASSGKPVVLPTDEVRARMMRRRHQPDTPQASKSRCIAGRSRAGVRAEGGAN